MENSVKIQIIEREKLFEIKSNKILGIVEYGKSKKYKCIEGYEKVPYIFVEMKSMIEMPFIEVWYSDNYVEHKEYKGIKYCRDGQNLFVGISRAAAGNYKDIAYEIYEDIFTILNMEDTKNILRIWNYIPNINVLGVNEENYKEFCVGRECAFDNYYSENAELLYPAATGIGCKGNDLTIYLIARKDGKNIKNIENPRQVPSYKYPSIYGSSAPRFARASYVENNDIDNMYLSGTASIIGHETIFINDIEKQCITTIKNIETIISSDNLKNYNINKHYDLKDIKCIKVYIKRENDYEIVREICETHFGPYVHSMYFIVDICRSDLLVEIEALI